MALQNLNERTKKLLLAGAGGSDSSSNGRVTKRGRSDLESQSPSPEREQLLPSSRSTRSRNGAWSRRPFYYSRDFWGSRGAPIRYYDHDALRRGGSYYRSSRQSLARRYDSGRYGAREHVSPMARTKLFPPTASQSGSGEHGGAEPRVHHTGASSSRMEATRLSGVIDGLIRSIKRSEHDAK